jgi:L-rhamnose mutarotase
MKRFCLTLDLKDDPELIAEYEKHHQNVWEAIQNSITDAGIISMQIYRLHTRMMMIMETEDDFSFELKNKMDANNPVVQEWEELMWKYQQALPIAKEGEKWMLMDKIFELTK